MKRKRHSFKKIDYKKKQKEPLEPLFEKQGLITALSVFLVVLITMTGSFAIFSKTSEGNEYNVVQVGELELSYVDLNDEGNVLQLADSYPISDTDGEASTPYRFSVENTGTIIADYTVKIVDDTDTIEADGCSDNLLDNTYIRYKFDNETSQNLKDKLDTTTNEYVIYSGTLEPFESNIHEIRLWINENSPNSILGTHYHGKVVIEINQNNATDPYERYHSDNSGANTPVLTSGMIPVIYTKGNWVKADTSDNLWYNYDAQRWANAVTVTEATRDTYMSMDAGEPISMDDINTMWVWIPRYEYQYTDLKTNYAGGTVAEPGEIKINFISSDTITPSDSNTYQIPEGFKFGEENIPGFWIGKFETSTLESCTAESGVIGTGCDLTTLTPQIKPGVTSWRGARVSTFFEASRLMQSSDETLIYNADTYGFDAEGTSTMDTHVLKNTEWGIVAMLSQSKYGKYGNSAYTGTNKEVYVNKSSDFITGMSNGTPSRNQTNTQVTYDIPSIGHGASTTGTIYGVYDMSGGSSEYVMGNYNNYSGNTSYNSGFCGTNGPLDGTCREWPNAKYVDVYTSTTLSSAYKFGDGIYETSGWYGDNALSSLLDSTYPWLRRGGDANEFGLFSGLFGVNNFGGNSLNNGSSRFVIKP